MKKKTSIAATTLAVMAAAIPAYAAPADEAVTTNLDKPATLDDSMLITEDVTEDGIMLINEEVTEDVELISETVTQKVKGLEDLPKEVQEKVDSIIAELSIQENGTIIDLVGDEDDLANIDTLEVTEEGLFINVGEERLLFDTGIEIGDVSWDDVRVIRLGGTPVPHKPTPEGFTITTKNLKGLVVMPKEEEPFSDVNEGDWFQHSVTEAFNYGFITGTTGETFEPYSSITRGQFATILARVFEIPAVEGKSTLTDIHEEWFAGEVQALVDLGIIKGYSDGTFGGHKPVTRQQVALMFNRTLEVLGKDVQLPTQAELDKVQFGGLDKSGDEAVKAIKTLAALGAVTGAPSIDFKPHTNASRAEVVEVLVRALPHTGLY